MNKRIGIIAAGALASLTLLTGSAQAATATAYTSPSTYGNASFNTTSGLLTIRDTNADSHRVVAFVWNLSLGGLMVTSGADANGSNSTPGYGQANGGYQKGHRLEVEVCRRDGANGFDKNCDSAFVTVN